MSDFDFSAIARFADELAAAAVGPRFHPLPEKTFPAPSLMSWMRLAQTAQIPVVPATEVARLRIEDVLNFEETQKPEVAAALAQIDRLNQGLSEHEMLRWDCCASYGVKASLSNGHQPTREQRGLTPDDPRAFDVLYEFPEDTIALVQRPWLPTTQIEGFPLEFRVFVQDGQVLGLANYYIQRDIPDTPEVHAYAAQAVEYTRAIVQALSQSGLNPAMPQQPNPEQVCATLDFLVDDQGVLRFLEAGPGFGWGAHPCAFLKSNGEVAPIQGLCLGSDQLPIALEDLPFISPPASTSRPRP